MAVRGLEMGLVMVLSTALWAGVSAQLSCTTAIVGLAPCMGYITGNASTPSSSCCSQLSSVVSNQPQCLCSVLNGGGSSFGINLNQTQALALPGACNVQTPPASRCNAAAPTGTPVSPTTPSKPAVPTASTPTAPTTPTVSTTPPSKPSTTPSTTSGGGSKTVPSTGGASSDASSTAKPLSLSVVLSILFIGSYASAALIGF
ncbi:hypothetical protein MRB53_018383 [Persea americana]|uniref:Uncharacterized protein n=1 Tax=Persea americana TaxID=3435 RepID=A0ACC2M7V2_PERAE|nr:hypothetical protein MRB53_018383 [Persea americana]